MKIRLSEIEASWQDVVSAVVRFSVEAPVGHLAEFDAERLAQASNNILGRLMEEKDKQAVDLLRNCEVGNCEVDRRP